MDVVAALIPTLGMLALFVALLITAYRATDGAGGRKRPPRRDE